MRRVVLLLAAVFAVSTALAQPKPADRLPVTFSPDGKLVLAGGKDGRIRVWDAGTGKLVKTLVRHTIKICGLAVSPDSKLVLAGCEDGTSQVYSLEKGELATEALVANELEPVTAVAFGADGKRFLVASQNRAVNLFELTSLPDRTGQPHWSTKLLRTFRRPAAAMASTALSPDGTRVLAGGGERVVVLWNAETKEEIGATLAAKDLITAVGYAPDGSRFLSASLDGSLKVWNAGAGKLERTIDAHEGGCTAAVFSRDSKTIVSAGKNGWWKTWDAATGKFLKAGKGAAAMLAVDLSPDGKKIVTATADRSVRLWDASSGKELQQLPIE